MTIHIVTPSSVGFRKYKCRLGRIMFGSIFRLDLSLTLRFIIMHYNCKQYKYMH